MYDAYWNGVFDVRWEDAPLGQEAEGRQKVVRGKNSSSRKNAV